jgi:hypothetical protein
MGGLVANIWKISQVSKMFCVTLTSNAPETKDNDFGKIFKRETIMN